MSDRPHLYAKIHKAQRAWLMRLLVSAGQVDPDDATAVAAVGAEATRLVAHIHEHGEHEDRFIHPLLREAAPAIAERLDVEHEALHETLLSLQSAAEDGNAQMLYAATVDLIMQYFPHLEFEERQAMPAIWRHFDDGALLDRVMRPFIASRSTADMIVDLNLQFGALNPQEERQLIGALLK